MAARKIGTKGLSGSPRPARERTAGAPRSSKKERGPARRLPTPRGVSLSQTKPAALPLKSELGLALSADPLRYIKNLVRDIPDFPKPGILFRDITPLLGDARGFGFVIDALATRFVSEPVDAIVGIEARGFIFGAALAARLHLPFVPVRKPGKLPFQSDSVTYALEYGQAELEIHTDGLGPGSRVLVVDDVLATGGTASAAGELVRRRGGVVLAYVFVLELLGLGGRQALDPTPVLSLVQYG
jgi:adenine phosphoribosyltransferase